MKIRRSKERGYFANEWLKSFHSFSFGEYFDRNHMHFSDLRVINHDYIAENSGFPRHPHRDMEIITYILKGTVEHQDSMENKTQIKAGEVQVMGAGTGVSHSEYNPSNETELELLQIWVMPEKPGGAPTYDQKKFSREAKLNQLLKIISPDGSEDSLTIRQDAYVFASILEKEKNLNVELKKDRCYWLQLARGELVAQDQILKTGDAMSFEAGELGSLQLKANQESEFLIFNLRRV